MMTNDELKTALEERQELVRIMDEAKTRVEQLTDQIKEHMGDDELLIVGPYKVTWKYSKARTIADEEAMKAAGIFDRFSKQQKPARPFKVST